MKYSPFDNDLYNKMQQPNPIETEKVKQLKSINANLQKEIDFAIHQADEAKKEALFSKRIALISLLVAGVSTIGTFLPYFFNLVQ